MSNPTAICALFLFFVITLVGVIVLGGNKVETEVTKLDSDRGIYVVDSPKGYPYTCFVLKAGGAMECVQKTPE